MGDVKMVSMLLPYCSKKGKAGKELMETALIRAARHGHLEVMHLLLQQGAHVNGTWDSIDFALKGWHVYSVTPTGFALSAQQWAAAELLIDAGAKVSEHLLFMAAEHGAPASTVRALVDKGARDIDNEAILTAAKLGHQDIVVELLRVDQQSVSKEDLMARFAEAFAGAAIGDQPSLVHHLCATLDHRLQDSTNTCGPADRQEFLSEALIKVIDMHHLQWIEAPDSSDQAPHDEMEPQPTAGGGSNGGDDVAPAVNGSHGEQIVIWEAVHLVSKRRYTIHMACGTESFLQNSILSQQSSTCYSKASTRTLSRACCLLMQSDASTIMVQSHAGTMRSCSCCWMLGRMLSTGHCWQQLG
jgi:hypothetical protein